MIQGDVRKFWKQKEKYFWQQGALKEPNMWRL